VGGPRYFTVYEKLLPSPSLTTWLCFNQQDWLQIAAVSFLFFFFGLDADAGKLLDED
jgi:hypothetical protein